MTKLIVYFLVFGLPFVVLPFGASHFEIPKVIISQILIEVLLAFLIIKNKVKFKQILARENFPVVLLLIFSGIGFIFLKTGVSFFGNAFRFQGVFLFWHLLIFGLISKNIFLENLKNKIFLVFIIFQSVFAAFIEFNQNSRAIGTFGEPNALASAAVFSLPFFLINERLSKYDFFGVVFVLLILVMAGSNSAVVAVFILFIMFFLRKIFKLNLKYTVILGMVMLGASYILPFLEKNVHESRVEVWRVAIEAYLKKPVFGYGFGNIEVAFKDTYKDLNFPTYISGRYVDSSHNIFLDYLLQGGILGAAVFLFLLYKSFNSFIASGNLLMTMLLTGLLCVLSFNPASVWIHLVFWYIIGRGVYTVKS